MRVERIADALSVLAVFGHHNVSTVLAAAHDATLLTWDELRARRIWAGLAEHDRASVYRLVGRAESVRTMRAHLVAELARDAAEVGLLWAPGSPGRLPCGEDAEALLTALAHLPREWRVAVLGGQRPPRSPRTPLDEAVRYAVQQAEAGLAPPPAARDWAAEWDREEDRARGDLVGERLARLPYGWQVDAVRRMALGTDALAAVSDAALTINIIRAYGVYLAWNAPHQPRRAQPAP